MWKMRVVILPLVLGTLGLVPFCLENHLKTLSMHYLARTDSYLSYRRVLAILSSCHFIRRFQTRHHQ